MIMPSATAAEPSSSSSSAAAVPVARLPSSGEVSWLCVEPESLTIRDASPGCRRLFERDQVEIVGRPASDLIAGLEQLTGAAEGSVETYARRGARPCHVRLFWTREDGGLQLLLVNLERLQSPFADAALQARFGSLLTHELRNPLSSIKMVVQTLARAVASDDRAARRLVIAAREVRSIERILSALSDLTRRMPARPEKVALPALLEKVAAACAPELAEREAGLALTVPESLPPVSAEPERLAQALGQLVCEAARISPGKVLELEAAVVAAGATEAGQGLRLELHPVGAVNPREFGLCLQMVEATVAEAGGQIEFDAESQSCRVFLPIAG